MRHNSAVHYVNISFTPLPMKKSLPYSGISYLLELTQYIAIPMNTTRLKCLDSQDFSHMKLCLLRTLRVNVWNSKLDFLSYLQSFIKVIKISFLLMICGIDIKKRTLFFFVSYVRYFISMYVLVLCDYKFLLEIIFSLRI